MIRAGEILGRPVVLREGGREAGRIKDVVVDEPGRRVLGFVVAERLMRAAKVVPWQGLQVIGPDAAILSASADIVAAAQAPEIKAVMDSGAVMRGLRVQTTTGRELGRIDDFFFDEQTGEIEGYEISGARTAGTLGGRCFLPAPTAIEFGKDVAFVGPEVEATIRQQPGGRRGVSAKLEQ